MPTTAKTTSARKPRATSRAKKVDTPPDLPNSRSARLRATAADNPEVPLLKLFEPTPDDHDPHKWSDKLRVIVERTPITVDILADRAGVARPTMYAYMSRGENSRGKHISQETLVSLAGDIGFEPEAWFWPLDRFVAMIDSRYPGYRYCFDTTAASDAKLP